METNIKTRFEAAYPNLICTIQPEFQSPFVVHDISAFFHKELLALAEEMEKEAFDTQHAVGIIRAKANSLL